jgi:hypothetical protein
MPNLKSLDNLYLILGFLVPGLIALFVRSQFVTGKRLHHTAALLSYFAVSLIYYALALPFTGLVLSIQETGCQKVAAWLALIFVGPAVLGLLLGINIQKIFFAEYFNGSTSVQYTSYLRLGTGNSAAWPHSGLSLP